jgi:repressor LexA
MQGLTDRQQQVLKYIRDSITDRGYPPTLREIGAHMGIKSTNGVNDHLRALERKGYLTREDMKSRALRPINMPIAGEATNDGAPTGIGREVDVDSTQMLEVPLLGRIAAGAPILAHEHQEGSIKVDPDLLRGGRDIFALRVQGDSMIDAGILSGDTIFVRKQSTANIGEIVCALIDDEATVKYYHRDGDLIRFQPANASMAPILVRASDFKPTMLLGVVVGVFRKV